MIIEQTIEVPASHIITIEIPKEVPIGRARFLLQFSVQEDAQPGNTVPPEAKGQISNETFRQALRRAYGAWKDKPWTNHLEDVNTIRDEWAHRDPGNLENSKKHRD